MLRSEVYRNRKGRKWPCQLMTENDNSWSQEDDSWRKSTLHVEMVGRQAGFFAQPPVLSTQSLFSLTPDTIDIVLFKELNRTKINHTTFVTFLRDTTLEVISKLGFWSHIKAAAKFKPEEYVGISRT